MHIRGHSSVIMTLRGGGGGGGGEELVSYSTYGINFFTDSLGCAPKHIGQVGSRFSGKENLVRYSSTMQLDIAQPCSQI